MTLIWLISQEGLGPWGLSPFLGSLWSPTRQGHCVRERFYLGSGHELKAHCLRPALRSVQGEGLSSENRGNVFATSLNILPIRGKNETLSWWVGYLSNLLVIYLNSLGFGTYLSNRCQLSTYYMTGIQQWTKPIWPPETRCGKTQQWSSHWDMVHRKLKASPFFTFHRST